MKTAMQELIEWCNSCLTDLTLSEGAKTALDVTIVRATDLLEKEKEQIMNANIEGTEHGYRERTVFGLDARPYSKKRAQEYYNQTYNNEKD